MKALKACCVRTIYHLYTQNFTFISQEKHSFKVHLQSS